VPVLLVADGSLFNFFLGFVFSGTDFRVHMRRPERLGDLLRLDYVDWLERIQVIEVDVEVDTCAHELVGVLRAVLVLLEHQLDVVGHDAALLLPRGQVPQDDGQVVGTCSQYIPIPDMLGTRDIAPVARNGPYELQFLRVVHFKLFQIPFHYQEELQPREKEDVFDFMLMS